MPETLGISDKTINHIFYFRALFMLNPEKEFSFSELYEVYKKITNKEKPNPTQLNSIIKNLIDYAFVMSMKNGYKFNTKQINEFDEKRIQIVKQVLQDPTIPIENKVKIVLPDFIAFAFRSFVEILSLPIKNTQNLQLMILEVKRVTNLTLDYLQTDQERQEFSNLLYREFSLKAQDIYNIIYENYIEYHKNKI